jgi:hypothetical protein
MDVMHRQPHILLISRPGVIPCVSDPAGSGFGLIPTNLSDLKWIVVAVQLLTIMSFYFCGPKVSEGTQSFAQVWLLLFVEC